MVLRNLHQRWIWRYCCFIELAFQDWDGSFYKKDSLFDFIRLHDSGTYVIEPYYHNNLGKMSGSTDFGKRVKLEIVL